MIARILRQNPGLRFAIRPYEWDDVAAVFEAAWESRSHVGRWMSWMTEDYSVVRAADWVQHAIMAWDDETDFEFVIIDQDDGSIAGSCGLSEVSRKYLMSNLGYWVRVSKLNQGAARQAVQLLADFGFSELGLNRLEIVIAPGNEGSKRVALASGALYEGLLHQRLRVGETVYDGEMYALLRGGGKFSAEGPIRTQPASGLEPYAGPFPG